jgi:hypothetical protein
MSPYNDPRATRGLPGPGHRRSTAEGQSHASAIEPRKVKRLRGSHAADKGQDWTGLDVEPWREVGCRALA